MFEMRVPVIHFMLKNMSDAAVKTIFCRLRIFIMFSFSTVCEAVCDEQIFCCRMKEREKTNFKLNRCYPFNHKNKLCVKDKSEWKMNLKQLEKDEKFFFADCFRP